MGKKYILLAIIIMIIGGMYFAFTYRGERGEGLNPGNDTAPQPEAKPDDRFQEVNLTLYNKERTVCWEVSSAELSSFEDKALLKLLPVSIEALNPARQKLYSVMAAKGIYRSGRGELTLSGPILINKDELEMETAELSWQKDHNLITGRGGVVFRAPFFTLTGDRFEARPDLNKLTVYGNRAKQAYFTWKERG
ncbi:MAG: hypothetical protein PWR10_700 [Halanaerobiales bacterium]|nr:hypothetical protein [Halanaerobiales bacterium]